jgi:fructokinase
MWQGGGVTEKKEQKAVLVWGEVLWDCLPQGLFLGGAPFNVGYHLRRLGWSVEVVSAVGADVLGRQIWRRADWAGLGRRFLVEDAERDTGWVEVELDEKRNATYRIVEEVAWDAIPVGPEVLKLAGEVAAVVYGSLAQRGEANRVNLARVLAATPGAKFMDINLRAPYDDRDRVLGLARGADLLKMNEEELLTLSGCRGPWSEACARLAAQTEVENICVTRGAEGAVFWTPDFRAEGRAEPVEVVDTIGAGDAFMAALVAESLAGHLRTAELAGKALENACRLGAFVASHAGATPDSERVLQVSSARD